MNYRNRGFDPERFFGPDGPFGPRGPLGPGGIFGPAGPFGTGGGWGQGSGHWSGEPDPRAHRGGRPRARRGDVRNAILTLLRREPMNGYQLMQEIANETDGAWRPSSGAIYPALAQLEDEGLVEQAEVGGRKAYRLTDAGREVANDGPDLFWSSAGQEPDDPWGEAGRSSGGRHVGHGGRHGGPGRGFREDFRQGSRRATTLWKALGSVAMATQAVGQASDDELTDRAAALLDRTRRDLYRMLAEAEVDRDTDGDAPDEDGRYPGDDGEITDGEIIED